VQKVPITELRKNDVVLIVCEMLVQSSPVKRFTRDSTVARVSGKIIDEHVFFWLSWKVRYTGGTPHTDEPNRYLALPLKNPEYEGIYDKITFYRFGKWDEASEAVVFSQED